MKNQDSTLIEPSPPLFEDRKGGGRSRFGMRTVKGMKQRIGFGALAIAIILAAVFADVGISLRSSESQGPFAELLRRGSILPIAIWILLLAAVHELNLLFRAHGAQPHSALAYVVVSLLALSPWLSAAGWLGNGPAEVEGLYWQVVWMTAGVLGACALCVFRGNPSGVARDLGLTVLTIVYLGLLPSFGIQLRCGRDIPGQQGAWLLLIAILVTKASDIGAYFVGSVFGRHRLIPAISPGKSVEGVIGGIAFSSLIAMLFAGAGLVLRSWLEPSVNEAAVQGSLSRSFILLLLDATQTFSRVVEGQLSPLARGVIFGACVATIALFGDLLESCFKREAGAKDSGGIMPTYGGILDLIDSPILVMPVAWFLLTAVWRVI